MSNNVMSERISLPVLWKKLNGSGIGAVLAKGAGGAFVVMVLGAVMAFGSNVLLARLMGVTQYGIYIYVLTWINLLALVCKLGMTTSLLRFVAAYNANAEWGLFRGVLGHSMKYVSVASILIGLVTAALIWILHDSIGLDQARTFWLALLLLPLLALTGLRSATLRALKHVVKAALPDSFFRPLLIIVLASISFLYTRNDLSAVQVMLFNVIALLIALYIGTVWLIKVLPSELRDIPPVYSEREWLKVSLPLFLMSAMSLVLHQSDIIMVGIMLDTEHAGIYAVAVRISELVIFGLTAVNAIAVPMISELYSTGKHLELQRMITLAARGIFVFILIGCAVLLTLGEYVLGLFGEEFVTAYVPLLILLAGQSVNALAGSVGFLMTMTGHQNQAAWIIGVSALINIILNIILIPMFGIIGAAIATAGTTVLWNGLMLVYVLRNLNINPTILARL